MSAYFASLQKADWISHEKANISTLQQEADLGAQQEADLGAQQETFRRPHKATNK